MKKKKSENSAADSFMATIESSEATDALIEAGDMALDHLAELAAEVPILKWIIAASKTVSSVRDFFLIRRIKAFMSDFKSLSPKKRREVIQKLDNEPAYAKRAAEAVLTLLDRVDSDVKAVWVSRGLRAYAAGNVTGEQLMRLNYAIERLLVVDAYEIEKLYKWINAKRSDADPKRIWGQSPSSLAAVSVGLATLNVSIEFGGAHPTELCGLFIKHILNPKKGKSEKER
jgi:DNA-directed RNA polymerase subunit F